jgi:predicted TIM-barrel fold metal-dependent hydrolase
VRDEDGTYETIYVDGRSFRRKIPSVFRKKGKDGQTMVAASMSRTTGGHDVAVRIQDLDAEGIWGELVYASLGVWQYLIQDPQLAREGQRVSNDWAMEHIQRISNRFVVTAGISLLSVDDAVEETYRCAEMGFRAIALPVELPQGQEDFNMPSWDPLWRAAEETGVVVAFHIGTGTDKLDVFPGPGSVITNYVETSFPGQRAIIKMVSSGALERYPALRVVCSEGGASWVPFIGDRMNEAFRQHGAFVWPRLSMLPKEFLYRQVYTSFQHDESAIGALTAQGYQNVMWGSDYPHVEGTFGHTQETLHGLFDGVDERVRYRITRGSFLELFPQVGEPPADWSEAPPSPSAVG